VRVSKVLVETGHGEVCCVNVSWLDNGDETGFKELGVCCEHSTAINLLSGPRVQRGVVNAVFGPTFAQHSKMLLL
jgi:hypothetical protein